MNKLLNELNKENLTLIVSCPKNNYEMAKAAWENGADAIKFHLNVHHHASGMVFGTFDEEKEVLNKILADSPIPVGVVIGGEIDKVNRDFEAVLNAEFDFFSLYVQNCPVSATTQNKLSKVIAADCNYSLEQVSAFEKLGADVCEISICDPDSYGTPLNLKDLTAFYNIINHINIPAILPTQKKVSAAELSSIKRVGFSGIMIGSVVTGNDLLEFGEMVKKFRLGIDQL